MNSPIAENYEKLAPIVERLYQHADGIAQLALLPLFLLSVLMAYSEDLGIQGAVVARLKRLVVTMLLLVAFPTLTLFIRNIGQEIALSIDNLEGIEQFLNAASQKASDYGMGIKSLLDFGNDLVISALVSASFVILYIARYLLVAFYHFYWMILIVTGPFLILGTLFESTSNLTKNLFKSLMLVASWPVVWAILSAYLKALPFQDAYNIEGGYTAIVVMNIIIAVALLFSPFLLSQFCEGAIVGMGTGIVSAGAKAATGFVGPKLSGLAHRAGDKALPIVRNYMPTRQGVYKSIHKLASKPWTKGIVLIFSSGLAFADARVINVRPQLSSVLCFAKTPDSVALGDARFFRAQKMGKNLLIRSTKENKETNLLVFVEGSLADSFTLNSNLVLPHTESVNCERKTMPVEVKKTAHPIKPRILQSALKNGLKAELLSKTWSSSKRDYLSLRVRLANTSSSVWSPNWSKIVLQTASRSFSHSGIGAERKEIQKGASLIFDIQFIRPQVGFERLQLLIPSNTEQVKLVIEAGARR